MPVDYFFEHLAGHKLPAAVVKTLETERRGAIPRHGEIDEEIVKLARLIVRIADLAMKARLKAMITALA